MAPSHRQTETNGSLLDRVSSTFFKTSSKSESEPTKQALTNHSGDESFMTKVRRQLTLVPDKAKNDGDEKNLPKSAKDSLVTKLKAHTWFKSPHLKESTGSSGPAAESVSPPRKWYKMINGAVNGKSDGSKNDQLATIEKNKTDALQSAFESKLSSTKEQFHKTSAVLLQEATVRLQASKEVLNEAAKASAQASKEVLSEAAKTGAQLSKDVIVQATSKVESGVKSTLDASKGAINQVQTSVKATADAVRAKPDQLAQSIRIAREDLAIKTAKRAKQVRNFAVMVVVGGCFAFGLGLGLGAGGVRRKIED